MKMHFNKKKCLELMKESNKLSKEGKSLEDYDKTKSHELTEYLTFLSDDIVWQSRKEYFQVLELFTSKSISLDEFIEQYNNLRRSNQYSFDMRKKNLEDEALGDFPKENEIDLQLNPESRGFTSILSYIENGIDLVEPDIDFDTNPDLLGSEISEEFFRLDLKYNVLPKLFEYCKESKIPYNIYVLLAKQVGRNWISDL